ncbi:nadph-dependent fmn reductase [Trichococcus palustris]|uniref:Nadph-dependent fmn reductase n=1 Tax=Trichococcus palustris TaxID=140314 RepID=A0A143YWF1_9LACT|nr:NADPH-dependent FMN reductase [Trichococcus palustris]CZQ98787.1 nadph-dependent fmn reductase [Trichococcus palustris]SFK93948.1 NAD(P)H-dependent FMN reductase [Trichococcus palustris]
MKNIVAIVGTNSKKSTNRQLLQYIQRHFAESANIELIEINDVPLFTKFNRGKYPESVLTISQKIEAADGVIISSPEYDHAITASLMNLLEWLSLGLYSLVDKPVMLTGASYGRLGSLRAQGHLRQILDAPELKARVMPNSEFLVGNSLGAFDKNGDLKDPALVKQLNALFEDFIYFAEITNKLSKARQGNIEAAKAFSWNKE